MRLLLTLFIWLIAGTSCKKTEDLTLIETELNNFVVSLQSNPPTANDLSDRIKNYITGKPLQFFGSTVSLLDANGKVSTSPYWYRFNGNWSSKNLMNAGYNIDTQDWLRNPIDQKKSIWTKPYFDAGGGDVWMRTYSVPVIVNGKIIAVATTDLQVSRP
jgi:hypothetical protein